VKAIKRDGQRGLNENINLYPDHKEYSVPRVPFPNVPIGEFTVARPFTAPGLFAYRHMQAVGLLDFPDFGGGDMSQEQRKDALEQMVNVQRPLAALVLFLGVVALEDFIRDLGTRLVDVPGLESYFPNVAQLRPVLKKNPSPYARQDRDPAPLSDWPEVNTLYERAIGVAPLARADLPKLHDLALIRHTVAHHAALVRPIDAPRFQYWDVQANVTINPPIDFVREVSLFLYQTGRSFETAVTDRVFDTIVVHQEPNWHEAPSDLILLLVETFNWFGKLITDNSVHPMPGTANYEEQLRAEGIAARARLTELCIDELREKHAV
jgi:hypothetical protein